MNNNLRLYVNNLIFMESVAHFWHLSTHDYNKHVILDDLYTELPEITDNIIETLMGNYGVIVQPDGRSMIYPPLDECVDTINKIKEQSIVIGDYLEGVGDVSTSSSIDNLLVLLDTVLYKLIELD